MDHLGDLPPELLAEAGNAALEAEHPVLARTLFRHLLVQSPGDPRQWVALMQEKTNTSGFIAGGTSK